MIPRRGFLLAAAGCAGEGRIPVERRNGLVVVRVQLDGREAAVALDTGAERSLLTRTAVDRLGLKLDPWVGTTLRGAGGQLERHQNVSVGVRLGGRELTQRGPGTQNSLAVSRSIDLGGIDGLLGGDLFGRFDLDLDLPNSTLALLDAACPAAGPTVALTRLRRVLLLAPIRLDGAALTALIDTGATASVLNARGAHRMGGVAGGEPTSSGAIGGRLPGHAKNFTNLSLGPITQSGPTLLVTDVPEPAFDAIIGLDLLARQRVRLSVSNARLSFA